MPIPIPQLNANQLKQSNLVGQLDLQAGRSAGVISGRVSPNAPAPIPVGSAVKLDTTNTGYTPWFLVCAVGDVAIGRLCFTERQSDPSAGDACEVAIDGGPIIWCVADNTILPQQLVEDGADGAQYVTPLIAGKQRGIALDPAAQGALVRVITKPSVS